jgi:hypothetical protein
MTALAPGTMADLADGPPIDGNGLAVVTMANVLPERVNWLWPGRIPYGKLTVLDGDPGQGKSTSPPIWRPECPPEARCRPGSGPGGVRCCCYRLRTVPRTRCGPGWKRPAPT